MGGRTSAEYKRAYYVKNKDKIMSLNLAWRERHPDRWKVAQKKAIFNSNARRSADPFLRLLNAMRTRIHQVLIKNRKTPEYLGCSYEHLRAHLEKQFSPGMSWENYGLWHVDHRVPLASATSKEEVLSLCHFSNLQPLWASQNQSKGARIG